MLNTAKKYLAEIIIFLTIFVSGKTLIDSYIDQQNLKNEIQLITILAEHAIELTVETLSTMSQSTRHYDRFAKKQFIFEDTIQSLEEAHPLSANLTFELTNFLSSVSSYMQLATMLKTSYRVVTQTNFQSEELNDQQQNTIAKLIILIASYQNSTQEHILKNIKTSLAAPLFSSNDFIKGNNNWRMFTLHIRFIVKNAATAEDFLEPIRDTRLNIALTQRLNDLNDKLLENYWQLSFRVLIFVVSLFMLFSVVMYRQSRELQKANTKAIQAAETKSQFLANMSHEIRTPMNGIMGLTDILLDTQLNGHQKDYLDKIKFSAKSLTTIINDILDFSKIESEKLDIEHIPFDIADLIDNVKTMVSRSASDKEVEFIIELDPTLSSSYLSDPVRLAQILMNLTSNAIKFTEKGHVLLRVTREKREVDTDSATDDLPHRLLIEVEDTGIGLSKNQQQKLFSRFTQAQSSTTRKYGGTGLGLTICKMLTELMNGSISVISEVDKGSTFSVHLPMHIAAPITPQKNKPLLGQNLLVVEDNPITLEIIAKMGETLGLKVKQAETGESALEHIETESFDYLLIDWKLPDLSGKELISAIKNKLGESAAIIIFTGFDVDYLDADLESPVLTKPLLKQDLYNALRKIDLSTPAPLGNTTQADAHQTLNESDEAESEPEHHADYSHLSVLLVEDNDINILVAKTILESFGIKPTIAKNGHEAVASVKANPDYDLVFMDIQMPEMDGIEATHIIREKLNIVDLPIVALTANVMTDEVKHYKEIGMNGHLGKPYTPEQFKDIIERIDHSTKRKD